LGAAARRGEGFSEQLDCGMQDIGSRLTRRAIMSRLRSLPIAGKLRVRRAAG